MFTAQKKEQRKKKITFFVCMVTAVLLGVTPVFAGGLGDLLMSMLGFLVSAICKLLVGLIETVAALFLNAMSFSISDMKTLGIWGAFDFFSYGVRYLSTAFAGFFVAWRLVNYLASPITGTKQSQSVGYMVIRALIFIPLTYCIQDFATLMLETLQSIYTQFYSVYQTTIGTSFSGLSSSINPDSFIGDMNITVGTTVNPALMEVAGIVIACLFILAISWNFVKLLLEMTQRFVVMLVYTFLSPLAMACGVTTSLEGVPKQALSLYMTSGVLWVMNIWSVGIATSLFALADEAVGTKSVAIFFGWAVITYGFLRIAQQLDDVFNAVGANNVRFSGSMLDDLVSMDRMGHMATSTVRSITGGIGNFRGNARSFRETGKWPGRNSKNPLTPTAAKIGGAAASGVAAAAVGSMAGTAAAKAAAKTAGKAATKKINNPGLTAPTNVGKNADGTKARGFMGQAGAAALGAVGGVIAHSTAANLAVGAYKAAGNAAKNVKSKADVVKNEMRAAKDGRNANAVFNALNKPTETGKTRAMKNLSTFNSKALENPATKQYVGEALGLEAGRTVSSLSVNKNGDLIATTKGADNSIKSYNVSKHDFAAAQNAVQKGPAAEAAGATTAETAVGASAAPRAQTYSVDDIKNHVADGNKSAGFTTIDGTGTHLNGVVTKDDSFTDENGKAMANFSVQPDGHPPISVKAPDNMSAQDVATAVVNNGESGATLRSQIESAGGSGIDAAQSAMFVDREKSGSVYGGTSTPEGGNTEAFMKGSISPPDENRASFSYSNAEGKMQSATIEKIGSSEEEVGSFSTFRVTGEDGKTAEVRAPSGTDAASVASVLTGSADLETTRMFNAQGGNSDEFYQNMGVQRGSVEGHVNAPEEPSNFGKVGYANIQSPHGNEIKDSADSSVIFQTEGAGSAVVMSRVGSVEGGDTDRWQAVNMDTNTVIGTVEAPRDASANDIAQNVISNKGDVFETIRETAGFGDSSIENDAKTVRFVESTMMHEDSSMENTFTQDSSHTAQDGSFGYFKANMDEGEGNSAGRGINFEYAAENPDGTNTILGGYVVPTGEKDEAGRAEYMYGNTKGVCDKAYLDDMDLSDLASGLASGNGGNNEAIKKIRKQLNIQSDVTDEEADKIIGDSIRAIEKGSMENPIQPR